jgi:hypothetical protein
MSVYVSRHQPRRQTTIAGKIQNLERYDRFYDITYEALGNRTFPSVTLPEGSLVVRVMAGPYDARAIPPGSSTSTANRFSGLRPDGRPGQGALYVGTVAGVLREYTHYSLLGSSAGPATIWKPSATDATATFMSAQRAGAQPARSATRFYLFRVNRTLVFADLRVTSLAPFMSRLLQSQAQRYGITSTAERDFLAAAAGRPDDYSASRGIADAVWDMQARTGMAGVCAFSSRADRDSGLVVSADGDSSGGLVHAVFGADGTVITALTPVPNSPAQPGFNTFADLQAAARRNGRRP